MSSKIQINSSTDLNSVVDLINKKYGKSCVIGSDSYPDPPRLPTGIFAVDYMLGGGLPLHQIIVLRGPEHGGKTSLAMSILAQSAKTCWRCFNHIDLCTCSEPPIKMQGFWADVEGTFNSMWAEAIGNKPNDYFLAVAEDGNQYGDMVDYALRADNCGLVVLDSVGALTPTEEMEGSLEDNFVALQARLISRMVRKLRQRIVRERKKGHPCMAILINQIRTNIGVMFGNPESSPGGHQLKHENSLTLRVSKRSMSGEDKYKDKERDIVLAQRHHVTIEKFKIFRITGSSEFLRATEDIPAHDIKKGEIFDYITAFQAAIDNKLIEEQDKNVFIYKGQKGSRKDFVSLWKQNSVLYSQVKKEIIELAKRSLCSNADKNM